VLDHHYNPTSPDEVLLFCEQQNFMYNVFLAILKTSMGKHLICKYEATRDTQSTWKDYIHYMKTSTQADLEIESIMAHLTATRYGSNYAGGAIDFILDWLEKLYLYEEMTPITARFPEVMKKALLQNALNKVKTFRDLKNQESLEIVKGHGAIPYKDYIELVQKVATSYDSKMGAIKTPKVKQVVNTHDHLEDHGDPNMLTGDKIQDILEEEEYFGSMLVSKAQQKGCFYHPSLRKGTWQGLKPDDQKAWDQISSEGKWSMIKQKSVETPKVPP